nr:MAG TPA: Protein of unknown function (DUF1492) [Caudoviricetes sp.]
MTKEDLEQLCDLRKEIAELEYKIARLSSRGSRIVSDKVQASSKDFPYVQTTVKIEGYDYVGDQKSRKQLRKKRILLQQRKEQAEALELRITQYINSISDSGIRRMIDYKYIEGYTWEKIGRIFHCDRTTAEKRVSNYLKEHPEE